MPNIVPLRAVSIPLPVTHIFDEHWTSDRLVDSWLSARGAVVIEAGAYGSEIERHDGRITMMTRQGIVSVPEHVVSEIPF